MRVSVLLGMGMIVAAASLFGLSALEVSAAPKTLAETCGHNIQSLAFCGCSRDWCEDRCRRVYETSSRLAACYGRCKQANDDCELMNKPAAAPGDEPLPPVSPKAPMGIITPPGAVSPGN